MPHEFRRRALLRGLVAACIGAGAVMASGPGAHHRGDRFQNNYLEFEPKGIAALIEWRVAAARDGLPRRRRRRRRASMPTSTFLRGNAAAGTAMIPAVTWIGHASALVAGRRPQRSSPIRSSPSACLAAQLPRPEAARRSGPRARRALPHIDVVLISHNHYDHLDAPSVRALAAQAGGPPLFIVPLGIKAWFADAGIANVVELDWWQSTRASARSKSSSLPRSTGRDDALTDRMARRSGAATPCSRRDSSVFFAGDTAYSKDFADIHERFAARHGAGGGFDVALMPIGAYEPRWFMSAQHVDPARSGADPSRPRRRSTRSASTGARSSCTDESLDEPPRALARRGARRRPGRRRVHRAGDRRDAPLRAARQVGATTPGFRRSRSSPAGRARRPGTRSTQPDSEARRSRRRAGRFSRAW